jgi:fumarate reductase flavoprotein subunit
MAMTRRSFIGAAAATAGALAAVPAFAGADEAAEGITVGTPVDAPDATEEADVVVVGSGIGGFFASMIAKEQMPEATVIMLEKNANLGGSTNYAECNGPQKNQEEDAARLSGYNSASGTNFIANSILHYERVKEAGSNADWLFGKHGCGWYQAGVMFYDGGNGASAINTLTPIAEEEGVDIRKSSRAFALVLADEYTVTGIQYQAEDGSIVQVNCKAVVLATGGMSNNKELLAQYSSQDMSKTVGWGEGQDGDGQMMAEQTAHGRANHLTVASLFNNVGNGEESLAYSSPLGVAASMQYSDLFVNEYGIRFCDESAGGSLGTSQSGKLIESQGYVFSIMDTSMKEKYEAGGCSRHYSGFADACVGAEIDLTSELEEYADKDYILSADTLDELADKLAEKVTTFVKEDFLAEIERYNGFCAAGVDDEYGKGADYLWACETGPFYALQCVSGMLNTCGGIRINRNAQVTDDRGKVIEGLFAAGVCTSGWDGEVYGGGTCQTVGMWAGSKAARYIVENVLGGTVAEDWMGDISLQDQAGGPGGGDAAQGGEAAVGEAFAEAGEGGEAPAEGGEAPAEEPAK